MKSDYDRWKAGEVYLFFGSGWCYPENNRPVKNHFYTKEEAIAFEVSSKYPPEEDFDWNDDKNVKSLLRDNEFFDFKYFWNEFCEEYDVFNGDMTTPNGEEVIAFGYYGYDG
jgi:hypothetical protein